MEVQKGYGVERDREKGRERERIPGGMVGCCT